MRPRPIASAILPLALTALLPLSACSALGQETQSSEPKAAGSQAPSFEPSGSGADAGTGSAAQGEGNESAAAATVDPGWDAPAQEAGGTFLSMHENEDSLEYRAVDSSGEILWTAQRSRACSAYLVTTTADGPIAVLMGQGPTTEDSLTSTASGYDLQTGQKRWGPVETPGAMLGNGLVFASAPKDFIGTGGPRTALNPATGAVAATEDEDENDGPGEGGTESPGESDDSRPRVIAMFGEHLVRSQGSDLVGEDLDGDRLWTRAAVDFGMSAAEAREIPWEPIGTSHALLGDAGSEERTLVDLDSGASVDSDISGAWFDSASNTLVTAGSDLQGFNSDGTERWKSPLPENIEVAGVGAGLIVFDSAGDGATARSARDGSQADSDAPLLRTIKTLGAPHHIAESGAALVGDPQTPLLITSRS